MDGKRKVIKTNRRFLGKGVSGGVLLPNYRGIEEGRGIGCVTNESQRVNCREIDRQSNSRPAAEILNRLGIKRGRPAESAWST